MLEIKFVAFCLKVVLFWGMVKLSFCIHLSIFLNYDQIICTYGSLGCVVILC